MFNLLNCSAITAKKKQKEIQGLGLAATQVAVHVDVGASLGSNILHTKRENILTQCLLL